LPLGLALALLMGSWISRRALAAVDQIITEVREISDGRSLHRRLAEPLVKDELGRLAATLNQMMTRLERSFAALRRFTADASHELKTPLTVLRAGVERAITTSGLPQDTLATLEETLQEIKRMTELVDALLTLARADEGIAPLHRDPGDLPHIFDRFWRADSARTRTGERPGAGLGLAICKWIAEAHGGTIDVQSRPGRGTTFTVTLPREVPGEQR